MEDKKSRLERLEQKLYSKKPDINHRERSHLSGKEYSLNRGWAEKKKEIEAEDRPIEQVAIKKGKFFNKILIAAFVFFVISIGYAGYIFLVGGSSVSGDDVNINIVGPVSIGGGEKLSLDVVIQNNNQVPLEIVDLVIDYPQGTKDAYNLATDLKRDRTTLGDIAAGSVVQKTIESALFGEEGDAKEITVAIEYKIPGSNAIFDTKKVFDIVLTAAPVRLVVNGLKEISSGQVFELDFKISSNTSKTLENFMVIVDYPFGFDFETANIDPDVDDNIWVFEEFEPGYEEDIKVTGRLSGQNGEDRVFRLNAGIQNDEQYDELGVILTNVVHGVVIQKPFVSLTLEFDDSESSEVVISSEDSIKGNGVFNNNTNDTIRDVEIEIRLDGTVLDDGSVKVPNGFYRSSDNTIIFNRQTLPALAEVKPRQDESFGFSFKTQNLVQGGRVIKNPQIRVTSSISGDRVSDDDVEIAIKEEEYKILKVMSDVTIGAYSLYGSGPFTNAGPIPPKVDEETTYTILWSITNSSNDLEDMKVVTTLPTYIKWNNATSPGSENVSYDSNSRQVTWDIGRIPAGTGFVSNSENLYLQLMLSPSTSQIGTFPNLVRNTRIIGRDTFTETSFERPLTDANTILQDYPNTINDHHFVIE